MRDREWLSSGGDREKRSQQREQHVQRPRSRNLAQPVHVTVVGLAIARAERRQGSGDLWAGLWHLDITLREDGS